MFLICLSVAEIRVVFLDFSKRRTTDGLMLAK